MTRCPIHDKAIFHSRAEAKRAADRMYDREKLTPYPCSRGTWHLGHAFAPPLVKKPIKDIGAV